jgi:PAS domain S-box-containing protein
VNSAFCSQLGYSREELIGKVAYKTFGPQNASLINEKIARRKKGLSDEYEMPLMTKGGEMHLFGVSGYPLTDSDGTVIGSIGVQIDLGERKRIQEELSVSERKFDSVLQSAQDAVVLVDNKGQIIYINDYAQKLFGYSRAELLQQSTEVLISDASKFSFSRMIAQIGSGEGQLPPEKTAGLMAVRKDGTEFPIEFSLGTWRTPKGWFYNGIIRDITDRVESQRKLEVAHERLNTLVTNMKEVFFSRDIINNRFELISSSCEEVYGYTPDEMRENPDIWKQMVHPEDLPVLIANEPLVKAGQKITTEYRVIRKDKKVIWLEVKLIPILDADGRLVRMDGSATDISKRRDAERKLQEKMNELNTFTYKASHDLRAPLTSMLGLVGVARQEAQVPNVIRYLDMIRDSAQKMDELLKDLMSVAMTSQGEINPTRIDLNALVKETLASIKFLPGFSEVEIEIDIRVTRDFFTDRVLLQSILANLFSNAIKYRNPLRPSKVWITVAEDEQGVQITVRDNGIGIPGALQPKVFDMFFRATELSTGSGLGLYIVKTGVEKLQGKITMSSEEKMETTFTILLPNSGRG